MIEKVLVVDDDEAVRTLLCFCLSADGFEVIDTEDGEEALTLATAHQPALILLDIEMPNIDGIKVCHRLKADPATASIPVLFFSGRGNRKQEALDAGGIAFLQKPFSIELLIEIVKDIVGDHGAKAH